MTQHARFAVFSLVSAIAYVVAYYNKGWQLFSYYPLVNKVSYSALDMPAKQAGPAMQYYGWMSTAALIGLAVALIVPNRYAAKVPSATGWIVPLLLIAFTLVYEKHWFL